MTLSAERRRLGKFKDSDPFVIGMAIDVRWGAAYTLGDIGSKQAVEPLKQALADGREYYGKRVKDAAFIALEKISRRNSIRITHGLEFN